MKRVRIYFHMFTLFFVLSTNVLFTTLDSQNLFDFHQENFNQKKHIELKQKEFLQKYRELKKQLLESFKIHQDDPQLAEEEVCKKPQPSTQNEQEKKDAYQHFLDINQSTPSVLITLKSNDNKPIQSKFAIGAIITAVQQAIPNVVAWICEIGAKMAAEEAARTMTAKLASGAIGAAVIGVAIKDQVDKNIFPQEQNQQTANLAQEQKIAETKRTQELKNQVKTLQQIQSLKNANPAQAAQKTEELRTRLAHADAQERHQKLIQSNFSDLNDNPNLQRTLVDAGVIKDTTPGYNSPPQAVTNPTKTTASQISTSTEAKVPNVTIQQSNISQAPTTTKSVAESQVPAAKTTTAQIFTQTPISTAKQPLAPTQEKIDIRPNPVTTSNDYTLLHHIAMQPFTSGQTTTTLQVPPAKKEVHINQAIADDNIISEAFASLVFPPSGDPDNDPKDDEENIEKNENIPSKDKSKAEKKSGPTPPRSLADKKASALRKAERLADKTIKLPDGRIRYYEVEAPSKTPGPTRGSSFVTEFDPKTGNVRQWNECYDHYGNVNRVRPKTINGRNVVSQHYPATYKDIQENLKGSRWHIPEKNLD